MYFSYATGYNSSSSSGGNNHRHGSSGGSGDGDNVNNNFYHSSRRPRPTTSTGAGSTLRFNLNDTINNLNSVGQQLLDVGQNLFVGVTESINEFQTTLHNSENIMSNANRRMSNKNLCNSCGRCFGFIALRKKKCDQCSLLFCSDCMNLPSSSSLLRERICKRCNVFSHQPLQHDEVCNLKVRDLKWYLATKHNFNSAHFTEKCELVAVIMTLDRRSRDNSHSTTGDFETSNNTAEHNTEQDRLDSNNSDRILMIELDNIKHEDDIQNLTVKQLKYLLIKNYVDYRGCLERHEFVQKVVLLYRDKKRNDNLKEQIENNNDGNRPRSSGGVVDESQCKICWEKVIDCVLLDCGHLVSCLDCGRKLRECPVCRQYIVRVVRVFKS